MRSETGASSMWPDLTDETGPINETPADDIWWKWTAAQHWLDDHPGIQRLAWCDDNLTRRNWVETPYERQELGNAERNRSALTIKHELRRRDIRSLLLAPRTTLGLTPAHMAALSGFLAPGDDT